MLPGPKVLSQTLVQSTSGQVAFLTSSQFYAGVAGTFYMTFVDSYLNKRAFLTNGSDILDYSVQLLVSDPIYRQETSVPFQALYNSPSQLSTCLQWNAASGTTVAQAICSNFVGMYNITFTSVVAGILRLVVQRGSETLTYQGQPYFATIAGNPTPSGGNSVIYGDGTISVMPGYPATIYVDTRDRFNNKIDSGLPSGYTWGLSFSTSSTDTNVLSVMSYVQNSANNIPTTRLSGTGQYMLAFSLPSTIPYAMSLVCTANLKDQQGNVVGSTRSVLIKVNPASTTGVPDAASTMVISGLDELGQYGNQSVLASGSLVTDFRANNPAVASSDINRAFYFTVLVRDQNMAQVPMANIPNGWVQVSVSPAADRVVVTNQVNSQILVQINTVRAGRYAITFTGGGKPIASYALSAGMLYEAGRFDVHVPPDATSSITSYVAMLYARLHQRRIVQVLPSETTTAAVGRLFLNSTTESVFTGIAGSTVQPTIYDLDANGNPRVNDAYVGPDPFEMTLISASVYTGVRRRRSLQQTSSIPTSFGCSSSYSANALVTGSCQSTRADDFRLDSRYLLSTKTVLGTTVSRIAILASGLNVSVLHTSPDALSSRLVYTGVSTVAIGSTATALVLVRDRFGNMHNAGAVFFNAVIQLSQNVANDAGWVDVTATCDPVVQQQANGTYVVSFTPTLLGSLRLSIVDKNSGQSIGITADTTALSTAPQVATLPVARWLYLTVVPAAANASLTQIQGSGLVGGASGAPLYLYVTPVDSSGNPTVASLVLQVTNATSGQVLSGYPFDSSVQTSNNSECSVLPGTGPAARFRPILG